ncbi:MAG TPA: AI-2E family transporter [Vicinamibacterales bacterium]|nr:AI-2E family transporter [Vicinamibacterales bacterium]
MSNEQGNGVGHHKRDQFGAVLAWSGLVLLVYLVYLMVSPFLVPLGWAAVFAILFHPLYARFTETHSRGVSSLAATLIAAVVVIAPMVAVVSTFAPEAIRAALRLQSLLTGEQSTRFTSLLQQIDARLPVAIKADVTSMVSDAGHSLAAFIVTQSGSFARGIAGFVFDLVISLFAMFFLLRDADTIMRAVRRLLPMAASEREELIHRTREIISIGVTSSLVVAAMQGTLGGLAFAILGLSNALFWGVIMAFCCLLPFGAWVIWLPASIVLAISGDYVRALILVGVGFGIVSGADNVVRPMMLSGRAKMNGLVIFISLLGGMTVFGVLGLVLGPILVATAMALLQTYMDSPRREEIELTGRS